MEETQKREPAAAQAFVIRRSRPEQLDEIMEIYAGARTFMAEHGNPTQWGITHPTREMVEGDIEKGLGYVCMAGDRIAAVFHYRLGEDATYRVIEDGNWLNDRPYGVVHRIASAGIAKGAASYCLEWALEQSGNLRIDTHRNNAVMQSLLKKLGFTYCGIIHVEDGSERLAYQKDGKQTQAL